jgi:glutathione S-transferase
MTMPDACMKLHWSPSSPYVRKVMIVAHELGLAKRIECVRAVVGPARLNPDLMIDNPLNKIPTLVDGATILYDSRVICEYLDALDGRHRMFPQDPGARWTALRRQALADGLTEVAALLRDEDWRGDGHRSTAHLQAFWTKIPACLDALEAGPLDASEPDIGHVAIACALSYIDFRLPRQKWRNGRPALAEWERRFAERSSAMATALVEAGKRPLNFYEMQ